MRLLQLWCSHRHITWPTHNRQHCLDCGKTRFYILGGVRGKWKYHAAWVNQNGAKL